MSAERYVRCFCAMVCVVLHVHRGFDTKKKPYALVSQMMCFSRASVFRMCKCVCVCVVVESGFDLFLLIVLVRNLCAWISL